MNYKQLLILKLSGVMDWKNEREMFIPQKMTDDNMSDSITCEFLGGNRYILRGYYKNKRTRWMSYYVGEEKHGLFRWWNKRGRLINQFEFCRGEALFAYNFDNEI